MTKRNANNNNNSRNRANQASASQFFQDDIEYTPRKKKTPPASKPFVLNEIEPKTEAQDNVFEAYDDGKNLCLYGTAGTGKSFLAMYLALDDVLNGTDGFKKVVIVRSSVPTRYPGFLPGTAKDKAKVYEAPYTSICTELFNRGDAYELLKAKNQVEFITTAFIRGITLRDCIVIVDEIQDMNYHELASIITRLGENCRVIFAGDHKQCDLRNEESGFARFLKTLERMKSFARIRFNIADIVRSGIVKEFLIAEEQLSSE